MVRRWTRTPDGEYVSSQYRIIRYKGRWRIWSDDVGVYDCRTLANAKDYLEVYDERRKAKERERRLTTASQKAVIFTMLPLLRAEIKACQRKARELGYEPEDEVMERVIPLLERRIKCGEVAAVVLPVWGDPERRGFADPSLAESIKALGARLIIVRTM